MANVTVSGLGSGLDYDSWITQLVAVKQSKIDKVSKQVSAINTQEKDLASLKGNYNSLLTAIQKLTDVTAKDSVFGQKAVTSSLEAITAKVDSKANVQSLKISVDSLATATTAKSANSVASYVDGTTSISDISQGAVKEGSFSVYVNGTKHILQIDSDDDLGSVLDSLNEIDGVDASINNGKLTIKSDNGSTVTVGSSSDTSNFSKVMSLVRNTDTGVYTSSKSIFDTNTSAVLTSTSFANGNVTAGTFKIGNAEFTINSSTTLDSLIKEINNNEDAGVSAYWDPNSGKLVLTSTDEGAANINVEAGTSNFTDIMGLTQSTWNGDGSIAATQLTINSQSLGTNAVLTINGSQITSSSNTVTSDISGIAGLTLTLNDKTSSTANVNITNSTSTAFDAIKSFVDAINTATTNTKTATSSTGDLYGESGLNMLKSNVSKTATAVVGFDNAYKSLADIGITTGAVTTDMSADISKLVIDEDKLNAALEANPDAVIKLFVGDSASRDNGALTKIKTTLNNSLEATKGYFTTRTKSFDNQKDVLNTKIDKMKLDLTKYQTQLEAKFQAMDTLISNLKNSSAVFDSYFNKKNSDSSSS